MLEDYNQGVRVDFRTRRCRKPRTMERITRNRFPIAAEIHHRWNRLSRIGRPHPGLPKCDPSHTIQMFYYFYKSRYARVSFFRWIFRTIDYLNLNYLNWNFVASESSCILQLANLTYLNRFISNLTVIINVNHPRKLGRTSRKVGSKIHDRFAAL